MQLQQASSQSYIPFRHEHQHRAWHPPHLRLLRQPAGGQDAHHGTHDVQAEDQEQGFCIDSIDITYHVLYYLFNTPKVFSNPEDAKARGGKVAVNDDVERVRRAHQNDIENIYLFFANSAFYLMTEPNEATATNLVRAFAAARLLHTVVYVNEVKDLRVSGKKVLKTKKNCLFRSASRLGWFATLLEWQSRPTWSILPSGISGSGEKWESRREECKTNEEKATEAVNAEVSE